MNNKYIQPQISFIKFRVSGVLAGSPTIPEVRNGNYIDNIDDIASKSYQGGLNSLGWEDDKE